MGKTKVVHIITKLELGGAQQNTLFTVAHLTRSKYEPVLIAGTAGILVEDALKIKDVKVYLIPELVREIRPIKDVIAFLKLRQILKQLKREVARKHSGATSAIIVHTHCSKAGILGRWAARIADIKLVIHSFHGFSFNEFQSFLVQGFYIFMERITSLITAKSIAVSKANIEKGVNKKIFTRDKVILIRSGIDIEKFQTVKLSREKKRMELGFDAGIPLVAMIACFKPQKSPLNFVRVAKIVSAEISKARFLLIGNGVLRSKVEELIEVLSIEDRTLLLGWRRDIPEIMNCIDILVLTSLWEGLPRVFPQAMASGIPVVATGVDGIPEAIQDGVNGFLLPPGDIDGMAAKIIYLIRHPEKAREMGEKGKRLVGEFDIWRMLEQQEELYANLLK
ncbi:MAG: glycosyltransferase family 4 protein, partial [Deltaproteobacteria bacterium]|nr:glycosyltransferase family 4 protein [Deltaproteobacteria bacterium]